MGRLTRTVNGADIYAVDDNHVQHNEYGYSGEAISKLAQFENMYEDLIAKQDAISKELEKLRSDGKMNTVKFKQLLANKLANNNVLILLKTYGL